MMKKTGLVGLFCAMVLFSAPAFSAQVVANTSQKGSLLIFPLIDIRPGDTKTTIVEISNDANAGVYLNCNYINQRKDRVDFHFALSPKDTVTWDVLTGSGDIAAPPFPIGGRFFFTVGGITYPDPNVGELVCFAVDVANANQVRFNHLTGNATVVAFSDRDAHQPRQSFKYKAWSFTAQTTPGATPPPDNSPVGTPGVLILNGRGTGTYDACPAYLIESYSPGGTLNGVPNTLGKVTYLDNELSLSLCLQDLREYFEFHPTKFKFTVWNGFEQGFSGAYQCGDSVNTFGLDDSEDYVPVNANLSNFTFGVLRTHNARFEVDEISDVSTCPKSQGPFGVVGVLATSVGISNTGTEDAELGSTLHGAGIANGASGAPLRGLVLWDPAPSSVPEKSGQR